MALGALPYHGRITGATPLQSGDFNLQITVTDNNSNVLQVTSCVFSAQAVSDLDLRELIDTIENIIFNQMLSDGGSFAAAVLGVTTQLGE
jgi:hypothetical protein